MTFTFDWWQIRFFYLVSETEFDRSFPTSQLLMSGYSNIYRLDQNNKGGVIMFFIKANFITFPVNKFCFSEKTHTFCLELNLKKQKELIFCCYNHHKHLIKNLLVQIKN